jgi:hypothetical protein
MKIVGVVLVTLLLVLGWISVTLHRIMKVMRKLNGWEND